MWIVTDAAGAVVAGPSDAPPEAGEGQTLRRVPLGTVWNAQRQAFVDAARWLTKFEYQRLWPKPAIAAVMNSANADMAAAWASFLTWDGPINLEDVQVVAGIDLANVLGILTEAQALRIKAGLPPEEPGNG